MFYIYFFLYFCRCQKIYGFTPISFELFYAIFIKILAYFTCYQVFPFTLHVHKFYYFSTNSTGIASVFLNCLFFDTPIFCI